MNKLSWITISASLLSSLSAAADNKVNINDNKASYSKSSLEASSQLSKAVKKIKLNKKPILAGTNCCVRNKA